jgi:hypothetical protein
MQPDVMTTIVVGVLLALNSAILAWINKGQSDALRREIVGVRSDLTAELRGETSSLKDDIKQIRTELVSIHATLAQIALAVNARPRPEAG